jgi:hypothetical protein
LRLQTPIVSGEMNKATAVESAPSQPAKKQKNKKKKCEKMNLCEWNLLTLICVYLLVSLSILADGENM